MARQAFRGAGQAGAVAAPYGIDHPYYTEREMHDEAHEEIDTLLANQVLDVTGREQQITASVTYWATFALLALGLCFIVDLTP